MHRYFILVLITLTIWGTVSGQQLSVSEKIAQKMYDSLGLTLPQKQQILDINLQLEKKKAEARKVYTEREALTKFIQNIEKSRDSYYQQVLTKKQFAIYKKKKRYLVNNR